MSAPLVNAAAHFMNRRGGLVNALDEMANFLTSNSQDVSQSGAGESPVFHHLNARLLVQAHLANVLEASHHYDHAVRGYLAAKNIDSKTKG